MRAREGRVTSSNYRDPRHIHPVPHISHFHPVPQWGTAAPWDRTPNRRQRRVCHGHLRLIPAWGHTLSPLEARGSPVDFPGGPARLTFPGGTRVKTEDAKRLDVVTVDSHL